MTTTYHLLLTDAKREAGPPPSVEDREDREDELPTVVVLKAGDVNQDEFIEYRKTTKKKGVLTL